jgi:hypothetical protein
MGKMWEAIQIYSRIKRPSGKGSWDDQIYMWSMPTRLSVKNNVQVTRASTYWGMYKFDEPWATRRVPLVEQELLTLLDHLSSPPIFGGFCVAQFLVLSVVFGELLLDFFILVILLSVFLDFCWVWLTLLVLYTSCSFYRLRTILLVGKSLNSRIVWQLFYLFCSCI